MVDGEINRTPTSWRKRHAIPVRTKPRQVQTSTAFRGRAGVIFGPATAQNVDQVASHRSEIRSPYTRDTRRTAPSVPRESRPTIPAAQDKCRNSRTVGSLRRNSRANARAGKTPLRTARAARRACRLACVCGYRRRLIRRSSCAVAPRRQDRTPSTRSPACRPGPRVQFPGSSLPHFW